jgi:hypothetical protein
MSEEGKINQRKDYIMVAKKLVPDASELSVNGTEESVEGTERGIFTREDFAAIQADRDLSPSLAESELEEEESYVPIRKPGKAFITIHPTYELHCAVTFDVRSTNKDDPYIVARSMWSLFPPALLRVKRMVLYQSFQDERLRTALWILDWHEAHETASEFHKSVGRVLYRGRQGWGQALYDQGSKLYTWLRWPEKTLGAPPGALWPERDFDDIILTTFADRFIKSADHDLVRTIGVEDAT